MSEAALTVPTNVNQMINDLVHDLNGAKETLRDQGMPGLFKKYDFTPPQMMAFKKVMEGDGPPWKAFGAIGLKPIHQILLSIEVNPEVREHLSMRANLERYEREVKSKV